MSRRRLDDATFDAEAVDEEGLPLVRLFTTFFLLLYMKGLPKSMWHREAACQYIFCMLLQAIASLSDKWRRSVDADICLSLFSAAVLLSRLTDGQSHSTLHIDLQ